MFRKKKNTKEIPTFWLLSTEKASKGNTFIVTSSSIISKRNVCNGLNKPLDSSYIVKSEAFKPGSHMPPNYLRHSCWYCVGYCSHLRTCGAGITTIASLYAGKPAKFNFAGTTAVKVFDGCCCRRRMFSYVGKVSQALPAAISQVVRRHMRTWQSESLRRNWKVKI